MKKNNFGALPLSEQVVEALSRYGYSEPTPIQKQAIPVVLSGNDVIAQAQTGTGKTLAFVLPIIETLDPQKPHVQALIVTPTRELAIQISDEVERWAPLKGLRVLSAYGGQDVERQIRKLEGAVHIVIATPGRLLDHIRRETVKLYKLAILVLDEADQMLHMGFLPEVEEIIAVTPSRRQTLLFSATMPQRIRDLAQTYMRKPVEIEVKAKRVTLDEIEQTLVQTTDRGKLDALCNLINEENPYLGMIFCRTKLRAAKLRSELEERGFAVDELHGDLTQAKREQVMKRFREARIQLLVATDIAARGLDVEGVTHVFNYDIPHDAESYIHRIGRTGRAGETGRAFTFAAPRDGQYVELIERGIKASLAKRSVRRGGADATLAEAEPSREGGERGQGARRGGNERGAGARRGAGRTSGGARAGRDGGGQQTGGARRGSGGAVRRGGQDAARGRGADAESWSGSAGTQAARGRGQQTDGAGRGSGGAVRRGRGADAESWSGSAGTQAARGRGRGTDAEGWSGGAGLEQAARGRGAGTGRASGSEGPRGGRGQQQAGARRGQGAGREDGARRGSAGRSSGGAVRRGGAGRPGERGREADAESWSGGAAAQAARGRGAGAGRASGGEAARGGRGQQPGGAGRGQGAARDDGARRSGGAGRSSAAAGRRGGSDAPQGRGAGMSRGGAGAGQRASRGGSQPRGQSGGKPGGRRGR